MKIAFIKSALELPARSGDNVHGPELAQALSRRGHEVRFLVGRAAGASHVQIPVEELGFGEIDQSVQGRFVAPIWRRFYAYFGGPQGLLPRIEARRLDDQYDVVVGIGPETLLLLGLLKRSVRIWYAADELLLSQLSQRGFAHRQLRSIATKWLLERSLGRFADDIWVVSPRERRWMRSVTGHNRVTVIPNGVDTEYFAPGPSAVDRHRAVFWGRLDFPPNVEAVRWFLMRVWPQVRSIVPDAEFLVIGTQPTAEVMQITAGTVGVELLEDVPDLRDRVCSAPIAVFPFVSGSGIKNKVLEGAAMGRALVLSSRAAGGLQGNYGEGLLVCPRPRDWVRALVELMQDPQRAGRCGLLARQWVSYHHTWSRAAELAESSLDTVIQHLHGRKARLARRPHTSAVLTSHGR